MTFVNGIVINPDIYLLPNYKISPFNSSSIFLNSLMYKRNLNKHFDVHRDGFEMKITTNAREGLALSLLSLNLNSNDVVTILTTTSNFYISSCVTKEIELFCKWSRDIQPNTKVLFVNHEFGFPYENLLELKSHNLPIIEDCAHSFFSQNAEKSVGKVGDFILYSLPKIIPVQIGGLLYYKSNISIDFEENIDIKRYTENSINFYLKNQNTLIQKRRENYQYLSNIYQKVGLKTRFELKEYHVPGVFMFILPESIIAQEVKDIYWKNGIESSVFYGENVVFIPVHQNLKKRELKFFLEVFLKNFEL